MKQEILNRLNAAYDATQNSCIAITLSNYIDTVEGISEEDFDREVYEWYDKALADFGYPRTEDQSEPSEFGLFDKVLERMSYVEGQNNYVTNCIILTYFDGRMYAESVCVNEYGSSWSNEDYQEIDLDERELYEVFELMHGSNFVRIFDPEFFNN